MQPRPESYYVISYATGCLGDTVTVCNNCLTPVLGEMDESPGVQIEEVTEVPASSVDVCEDCGR